MKFPLKIGNTAMRGISGTEPLNPWYVVDADGKVVWDVEAIVRLANLGHVHEVMVIQNLQEIEKKIAEREEGHLVCDQCGSEETPPYDEGDGCLCGGVFREDTPNGKDQA